MIGSLLSTLALATTLTVTAPPPVSAQRPHLLPDAGEAPTVTPEGDHVVLEFDGGWMDLRLQGRRYLLHFEEDWSGTLNREVAFEGDDSQELNLAVGLTDELKHGAPNTPEGAAKAAGRLRKQIKRSRLSDAAKQRTDALVTGWLADIVAQRTNRQVLFKDEGWYRRLSAALAVDEGTLLAPTFWSFGWTYGRMAAGVKALGAEQAVGRLKGRTDAIGLHPSVAGALEWASQLSPTEEHLTAMSAALEAWEALDAPPSLVARYRAVVKEKSTLTAGHRAPPFEAPNETGELVHSETFRGRVVVLDFWGTWCAPCISAIPELSDLAAKFGDQIYFVAVAAEKPGTEARWRAIIKKHGWTGAVHLFTQDRALQDRYQVGRFPTYTLVDAEGKIIDLTVEKEDLAAAITAALE
jgi:thiol-disulfide isomerase/thioredoxin